MCSAENFLFGLTYFLPSSFRKYIACIFQAIYSIAFALKFYIHTGRERTKNNRHRVPRQFAKHSSSSREFELISCALEIAFNLMCNLEEEKNWIFKLLSQHVIGAGWKRTKQRLLKLQRFLLKKSIARKFDTCFLCKLFPRI